MTTIQGCEHWSTSRFHEHSMVVGKSDTCFYGLLIWYLFCRAVTDAIWIWIGLLRFAKRNLGIFCLRDSITLILSTPHNLEQKPSHKKDTVAGQDSALLMQCFEGIRVKQVLFSFIHITLWDQMKFVILKLFFHLLMPWNLT